MSSGKKKGQIALGVGIGVLFGMLTFAPLSHAASPRKAVSEGNLFYKSGEYDQSAQKYQEALEKDPESDIINFDMGTALHKQGRHQEAFDHLQKALLSDDEILKEMTHYNLGNTLYHWGIAKENENIEGAISSLQNALKQYEDALTIKKDDDDALHNRGFVQKELERLLKKQEKKDSSPQQKKDQAEQPENQQEQSGSRQDEQNEETSQQKKGEDSSAESQGSPKENHGDERKDQDSSVKPESLDPQTLTESEARKLLENYQQTEEPKGLLNVFQGHRDTAPVLKDW